MLNELSIGLDILAALLTFSYICLLVAELSFAKHEAIPQGPLVKRSLLNQAIRQGGRLVG